MVDLCDKGSEFEDMNNSSQTTTTPDRVSSDGPQLKTCFDCGTTKTPVWRGGPAGPKTLCNACGIRSRKRRRALLGLNNKDEKKTKKTTASSSTKNKSGGNKNNNNNNKGYESTSSSADSTSIYGDTLKRKLFTFGAEVSFQRPRSNTTQRRKLGEEEEAAFLLMALSCGSVYA